MTWDVLNVIGAIAFVFTTAFGGSTIRNLLIGIPIETIWAQGDLFIVVFLVITIVFLLPNSWIE